MVKRLLRWIRSRNFRPVSSGCADAPSGQHTASRSGAQNRSRMEDLSSQSRSSGDSPDSASRRRYARVCGRPPRRPPRSDSGSTAWRRANTTRRRPAAHPSTCCSKLASAVSLTASSAVADRNSAVSRPVNRRSSRRTSATWLPASRLMKGNGGSRRVTSTRRTELGGCSSNRPIRSCTGDEIWIR